MDTGAHPIMKHVVNTLGGTRFERRTLWGRTLWRGGEYYGLRGEHVVGGGHFGENNFERETRGRTLVGESVERRDH